MTNPAEATAKWLLTCLIHLSTMEAVIVVTRGVTRMSQMQLDVAGLGHCAVDYLGVVGRYPEVDSKIELS